MLADLWTWIINSYSTLSSSLFFHVLLAASFGVLVGAAEILSRYKDEPFLAMKTLPGLGYLGLNGLISAAAFGLLKHYSKEVLPSLSDDPLMTSFVAGFGAMAVMRSKLFSFKTERGEEFAVGPDAVITTFLRSVDRKIDRIRSAARQTIVLDQVSKIKDPKNKAPVFLIHSLASYQNLSTDEKTEIAKAIQELSSKSLDPDVLLMAIGFGFLNLTGESNFSLLMTQLGNHLNSMQADVSSSNTVSAATSGSAPSASS
jgi:hypothetical protein